jgi:hypothetical protein
MPGVALSRWTPSFFAVSLLALVVAEALMVAGFGFPAAALEAPETLVVVHLVAVGWLSVLMLGALFQFVPVLTARPLYSDALAGLALACVVVGIIALVAGFLRLRGDIASELPLLPVAGVLLGAGVLVSVVTLGLTLWSPQPLGLPARFVVVGLAGLCITAALGIVFALVLHGNVDTAVLLDVTAAGVPVHAVAGLGGWLTFTVIGVSYRLLAMFMLAPELDRGGTRWLFRLGALALAVAAAGGIAAAVTGARVDVVLAAAGVPGLAALVLYARDVLHLYRARMRKTIELNSRMAILAFASLAAAVILTTGLAAGSSERLVGAVVFLVAFGWLTGLGLAKLYKIVAFLTWLECYGPVLGRIATPRVQDLVDEKRAAPWFYAYFLAVWAGTVALLVAAPIAFRIAAAVGMVATAGIIGELVRTRRLADVAADRRLPAGARRPRLFVSTS